MHRVQQELELQEPLVFRGQQVFRVQLGPREILDCKVQQELELQELKV